MLQRPHLYRTISVHYPEHSEALTLKHKTLNTLLYQGNINQAQFDEACHALNALVLTGCYTQCDINEFEDQLTQCVQNILQPPDETQTFRP